MNRIFLLSLAAIAAAGLTATSAEARNSHRHHGRGGVVLSIGYGSPYGYGLPYGYGAPYGYGYVNPYYGSYGRYYGPSYYSPRYYGRSFYYGNNWRHQRRHPRPHHRSRRGH